MNKEKAKEIKRIKLLRILFFINIFLVVLSLGQIIFTTPDNFHKVMNWVLLIIWTSTSIIYWYEFKKAKVKFQENQE